MEVDYKTAKEAFVADNVGSSIWSIQITSFTALTAYIVYSTLSRQTRGPYFDYITTILTLLLSMTLSSHRPYFLNGILLLIGCIGHLASPKAIKRKNDASKRSQGKWLDESDSDEEPSEPVYTSSTSMGMSRMSTSSSTALSSPISPVDSTDGTLSPDRLEKPGSSQRTFKRRHSPTPSTHTHTAINVLPTPETNTFEMDKSSYPSNPRARNRASESSDMASKPTLPFLTVYRSHMMIMTIHCILAVDFPVFPRHQGKCEDFGTSLMDVGVGSFVFSLGLVSSRAGSSQRCNAFVQILVALKKAAPILILGLIRVLMVKGAEYPEHVTEYGVHWNFFFTLGLLPVVGIALKPLQRFIGWTPLALVIAMIQQFALTKLGLESWIMSPSRIGLIGMNKEGIVSLPGYLAIYALGLGIGQHILKNPFEGPTEEHAHVTTSKEEYRHMKVDKRRSECAMELFGYSVAWWVLLFALRMAEYQVSRRMANMSYVLWTAAYNTTFLLGYLIVEMLFFPSIPSSDTPYISNPVPPLLEAINRNGLLVFLLGNLMTGLINVSMETMYMGNFGAMLVLVSYSVAISALAWLCKGFRLKL